MRFKTDENVPAEVAEILQEAGHDAIRVDEQGLKGTADPGIAAVCLAEHRVLITLDLDFADIRQYPPDQYHGMIVLRPFHQTVTALDRMTRRLLPLVDSEPLDRRLWIIDDSRVRIRSVDGE